MTETDAPTVDDIEEAMRDVVDPELGINVVDLGLVYGIQAENGVATIDMTLTSAACPLTDVIEEQARGALVGPGLVDDLKINWVWMPPWGPDKITDEGREQLRALGFRVAIDDLGEGYSGLTSLARVAPEFVKLDMSLVRGVDSCAPQRHIIRSTVQLCRALGAEVIAEGVETAAERDSLLELGCDLLQGYLFAKPSPTLAVPKL